MREGDVENLSETHNIEPEKKKVKYPHCEMTNSKRSHLIRHINLKHSSAPNGCMTNLGWDLKEEIITENIVVKNLPRR